MKEKCEHKTGIVECSGGVTEVTHCTWDCNQYVVTVKRGHVWETDATYPTLNEALEHAGAIEHSGKVLP